MPCVSVPSRNGYAPPSSQIGEGAEGEKVDAARSAGLVGATHRASRKPSTSASSRMVQPRGWAAANSRQIRTPYASQSGE